MYEMPKLEESLTRRGFMRGAPLAAAAVGVAGLAGCQSAGAAEGDATDGASGGYVGQPQLTPYVEPRMIAIEDAQVQVKNVLVVVDYQVDFVDGSLGRNERAIGLQDAICDRIKQYQDNGDYVFYTMDTHPSENYSLTREGGTSVAKGASRACRCTRRSASVSTAPQKASAAMPPPPGTDGRSPAAEGGASAPHAIRGFSIKHEAVARAEGSGASSARAGTPSGRSVRAGLQSAGPFGACDGRPAGPKPPPQPKIFRLIVPAKHKNQQQIPTVRKNFS